MLTAGYRLLFVGNEKLNNGFTLLNSKKERDFILLQPSSSNIAIAGSKVNSKSPPNRYWVSPEEWQEILPRFADASIYQTTEYARHLSGGKNLEHFVLKRNGNVCAAALVRLIQLPPFKRQITYIYWGPLWQYEGQTDLANLELALVALRQEYVVNRGLLLHVFPNLTDDSNRDYAKLFHTLGFRLRRGVKKERTFLLDLSQDLETIRRHFRRNWRNHLNKALRNNLKIVSGTNIESFDIFINLYQELLQRKKFVDSPDVFTWWEIQNQLPEHLKMRVFVCRADEEPVSAAVGTILGNKGIYLLGATSKKGMKTQGSYLIQWEMIQWLKGQNCRWYDLGGIDPQKNPGVFHFKEGMGGKDVHYLGLFEASNGIMNKIVAQCIKLWLHFKTARA